MANGKAVLEIVGEDNTAAAWRSALGHANESAERIKGLFEKAFIGISAMAIAEVGERAIELGDNLNKAAIKAGVTGKTMSELAYVAKMADVDLQGLSTGLKFMQKNLSEAATGSEKVNGALSALGLSVETLKGMEPDQQFEILADRISKLQDPTDRARAAVELFGKAGAELLPLFAEGAEGIKKAREEAQRLGIALSNEQISKLAEADDAIKQLKAAWQAYSTKLVAEVAPAITAVLKPLTAEEEISVAKAQLASIEHGYDEIAKAALRAKIAALEAQTAVKPDPTKFAMAMAPGVSTPQGYTDKAAAEKRAKEARDAAEKAAAADIAYSRAALSVKQLKTRQSLDAMFKDWDEYYKQVNDLSANDIAMDNANKAIRRANLQQDLQEMLNDWDAFYTAQKRKSEGMAVFADQAARNMQNAFANFLFDPFKGGLKGMVAGFADAVRRMVAEAAAAKIMKSLFGENADGSSGFGDFLGGMLGSIFGGPRAAGGPVSSGRTYLVGEHGPELFTPGGSGAITPNKSLGGGSVSINIDARNSTQEAATIFQQMAPALVAAAVQQARGQFRDDLSRGTFRR